MTAQLSTAARSAIFQKIVATVTERFYDESIRGLDWPALAEQHRSAIVQADAPEQFEKAVSELLAELKTSHVGFYHQTLPRATSKMVLSATYAAFPTEHGDKWIFQDVHEGGVGYNAGLLPGDVLLAVNGRPFMPPEHPIFPTGQRVELTLRTANNCEERRHVDVPAPTNKKNQLPYVQPTLVTHKRLSPDTGYLKITMYPGLVGVEVANLITSAVAALQPLQRLVIDLRGNTGGGIAVLRLMSFLTPKKLPVGYSLSREHSSQRIPIKQFPVFDRIPTHKLGLLPLAFKFARPKKPIMLTTEGLGDQPFHGRVVILANRHTASANEMLLAFAQENSLAKIVGEPTPGRLLSGSKFKVGHDYWLALPVGAYHTASGRILEGAPIQPDLEVPFNPTISRQGHDPQLDHALQLLSSTSLTAA